VLNTPSHHRVHHAKNPQYLDRNYAGMFIVWDRLFGTYAPERERPRYGITKPLGSFNPLWAQVHYLVELARLARGRGLVERLRIWLSPPDRTGPAHGTAPSTDDKYDVPVSARLRAYVVANFALVAAAAFSLMMWQSALPTALLVAGVGAVLLTTATLGGLMERKWWAPTLERLRVGAVVVGGLVLLIAR